MFAVKVMVTSMVLHVDLLSSYLDATIDRFLLLWSSGALDSHFLFDT